MKHTRLMLVMLVGLGACTNFTPREKTATYDPETKQLVLPHPCPDWSQTQSTNFFNEPHSNYGCAVNTNAALQLDDPNDLVKGHGDNHPDTGITTKVIEDYRAGKLPVALDPAQSDTTSSSQ